MKRNRFNIVLAALLVALGTAFPRPALAHCDTMDGPVVAAARLALDQKDLTPVLKWIQPRDEAELRSVFAKTLAVRSQGADARELADRYFFETLVRVHRAGEGAPYTGLKPAGEVEHGIAEADKALETGSVDAALKLITSGAAQGINERFARVRAKKLHANDSVQAGREYVAAYVDYIHYVEALHAAAQGRAEHSEQELTAASEPHGSSAVQHKH